jgi:hypothetical protein
MIKNDQKSIKAASSPAFYQLFPADEKLVKSL